MNELVYLLEGARTAFGAFGRAFTHVSATDLGIVSAKAALLKAQVDVKEVEHVIYGNVLQSSTSAVYMARHIALHAGIPEETPALIVNRQCASGLQAVIAGVQCIMLGDAGIVLAGGAENMSQAPHADFTTRFAGRKLGSFQLEDMLLEGLHDSYIQCSMGITAENLASRYAISREEQDEYAVFSHQRAAAAREKHAEEIIAVEVIERGKRRSVEQDEHIRPDTSVDILSQLQPAFLPEGTGTVTAGNASGLNDGAASLVLAGEASLKGRKPLARIVSWGVAGVAPSLMGIGPVPAARIALQKAGLSLRNIDLVEINEAFAAQYLAVEKELQLDRSKTNINGGAIAIGHPVGASGARILLTLAYELRRQGKRYGLAGLCIGGGQGMVTIIENQGVL